MTRDIKCKDYYIVKVKSNIYVKDDNVGNMERAKAFNYFRWSVAVYVTGKDRSWWNWTHMMDSLECAYEEMDEKHGVLTIEHSKHLTFLIPKDNTELFEWLKEECSFDYKVLKKTELGWVIDPTTWRREQSRAFTKKQIEGNLKHTYPEVYILDD